MKFEVKPLRHYDGAHYPSPDDDELERVERPLSLKMLVVFFALAVAFGLMACVDEQKAYHAAYYQRNGDSAGGDGNEGDYDILLGVQQECTPGEAFCDDETYIACNEFYYYDYTDCDAFCQNTTGMDARGCDASLPQPCDCYDIIDGDVAECLPGDVRCIDTARLATCNDDYYSETIEDCATRCQEQLGESSATLGCDATKADPCQCYYDMIDGGMTECMPGDLACGTDNTLGTCDNWYYEYIDCDQVCRSTMGTTTATSQGCDATDADDPCTCVDEGGPG